MFTTCKGDVGLFVPIPTLLPLTVIGASVKVLDVPEPDHNATF